MEIGERAMHPANGKVLCVITECLDAQGRGRATPGYLGRTPRVRGTPPLARRARPRGGNAPVGRRLGRGGADRVRTLEYPDGLIGQAPHPRHMLDHRTGPLIAPRGAAPAGVPSAPTARVGIRMTVMAPPYRPVLAMIREPTVEAPTWASRLRAAYRVSCARCSTFDRPGFRQPVSWRQKTRRLCPLRGESAESAEAQPC